jgi:glyoxylase-like metal-dependent hydrolase (beta-lactamase superfamily II)
MVTIHTFPSGPFQTNTYVVASDHEAVVVDPSLECEQVVIDCCESNQYTFLEIWLTHSHWDHTVGIPPLLAYKNVPVCVHRFDAENLRKPGSDGIPTWVTVTPVQPSRFFTDTAHSMVGKSKWEVVYTPGHSPGSCCLYCASEKILLTGDTLFHGTCGNVSFPTSSPALMADSLERLLQFPPETIVYSGHGPKTTLGAEREWMEKLAISLRMSGESDGC